MARIIRRRSFRRPMARRRKWLWVREEQAFSLTDVASFNAIDMLAPYKTAFGINLNLPDLVIWRILIKISIRFSWPTASQFVLAANDGLLYSLYVDNADLPFVLSPVNHQFDHLYQLYERVFYAELLQGTSAVVPTSGEALLFKQHDIKTRRKLTNQNESQLFTIAGFGTNVVFINGSIFYNMLVKMP